MSMFDMKDCYFIKVLVDNELNCKDIFYEYYDSKSFKKSNELEIKKYVQELKQKRIRYEIVHNHKKYERNLPCPCGSGKKFKKCCGKIQ